MSNYDKYQELLEASETSEGTAALKYEAYQDSLEAWTKKEQAAWEELANDANVNSFLVAIKKVSTTLIETLPFVLKYLVRITTAFNAYKLPAILNSFKNFFGKPGGLLSGIKSSFGGSGKNNSFYQEGGNYIDQNTDKVVTGMDVLDKYLNRNTEAINRNTAAQGGTPTEGTDTSIPTTGSASSKSSSTAAWTTAIISGLMSAMTASKTVKTGTGDDQREYEMSEETSTVAALTTGLATAAGSILGPLAGQAAGILTDALWTYILGPWLEADNIERHETAETAQDTLDVINEIQGTLESISANVSDVEEWTNEDWDDYYDKLEEIVESLTGEDNADAATEYLKELKEAFISYEKKESDVNGATSVRELLDMYADEPELVAKAIEQASADATFNNYLDSQAVELNDINSRKSEGDVLDNYDITDYLDNIWQTTLFGAGGGMIGTGGNPIGMAVGAGAGLLTGIGQSIYEDLANSELQNAYENLTTDDDRLGWIKDHLDDDTISDETREGLEKLQSTLNALINQENEIYRQSDEYALNAALLTANTSSGLLSEVSSSYLTSMGKDAIKELIAEEAASKYGESGTEEYNEAYERIIGNDALIESVIKSDEKLAEVWSGKNLTLSQALGIGDEDYLINFASALGVNIEQLGELEEKWGNFTLSNLLEDTTTLEERIGNISSLISKISDGFSNISEIQDTVIANYPDLIQYLGDSATLSNELLKKMQGNIELELDSKTEDLLDNEAYYTQNKDTIMDKLKGNYSDEEWEKILQKTGLDEMGTVNELLTWTAKWGSTYEDVAEGISESLTGEKGILNSITLISDEFNDMVDIASEYEQSILENQITNLNEQKSALSEIASQREYENKLIEAKLKLENAQKEKKRVWREGVGKQPSPYIMVT